MIKRTVVTLFSIYTMTSYIAHELGNINDYRDNFIVFIVFILPYILMNCVSCYFLIQSMLKKPKDMNDNIWMVAVSFLGCNLTLLAGNFVNLKADNPDTVLSLTGIVMSILIMPFYITSVVHLGRSLTVLPEANKLNTKGIYSISRHPLYTCYIFWYFTNILIYQSQAIIITSLLQAIFQIIRAKKEEIILEKNFSEYADYKKKVWWVGRVKEKQMV